MPKTDVKLYSTDAETGAKQTTTVSYVNPNANYTALKNFAQQLNSLTTNTYTSSDRIETRNLDTEEAGDQSREISVTNAGKNQTATITVNTVSGETGINPQAFYYIPENSTTEKLTVSSVGSQDPTKATYHVTIPNYNGTLYIGTLATANFNADFFRTTIS